MIKKISFFLFALVICTGCSSDLKYIYTKKDDTLEFIANRNFKKVKNIYRYMSDYESDIKTWNPEIINWYKLDKNQMIYVEYPYDFYIGNHGKIPEKI